MCIYSTSNNGSERAGTYEEVTSSFKANSNNTPYRIPKDIVTQCLHIPYFIASTELKAISFRMFLTIALQFFTYSRSLLSNKSYTFKKKIFYFKLKRKVVFTNVRLPEFKSWLCYPSLNNLSLFIYIMEMVVIILVTQLS